MHHISKYNKHKQIQHIKSYSIFYAIRQENPNIKDLHEAAINSSNPVLAASCQKQKKRSEAYGRKRHYGKNIKSLMEIPRRLTELPEDITLEQ